MSLRADNASTMDWLRDWAGPHRGGYVASAVIAAAGVVCGIVPYFAVSRVVVGLMAGEADRTFYWRWLAIIGLFWLLRIGFHGVSTVMSHRATFAVIGVVRRRLVRKLARIPMGRVLDTPSGAFKNTIVEKVDSIEPTLSHVLPEMTANALVPLVIVVYLFTLDWRMAVASLATLPLTVLCFAGMRRDYEARYRNYVDKNRHLNATAVEYIGGIEVIKAFNQSAASYEKFAVAARDAADSAIDWMKSTQVYFSIALAVLPATLVTVLPVGGYFFMDGTLAREDLVQIIILSIGIAPPLLTALSYSDDLAKIGTVVRDIAAVLSLPDLLRPAERAAIHGHGIELRGVSFGYGEKRVLDGVDLVIEPGSVTALVGPSGGGKSTIAKLIASLWDVDAGSVRVGETDIRDIPLDQLNAMVAYVAQDNYLFDDTVRNNIRMGRPGASDAEVVAVAQASGCHDFIMQLEQGYETIAGGAGGHLSGGERQRISIARAMLKDAPIVILDEATAYTDPENEAIIQQAVSRLVAGKTLIVVAHRLSTITDSDRIVVVEAGRIAATGSHAELLAACPLYRGMWEAHVEARDEGGNGEGNA